MENVQFFVDLLNRYHLSWFHWVLDLILFGLAVSLFVTYVCIPVYTHIITPIINILTKISKTCDMIVVISTELNDIKKELKTNGGNSIKDIVLKLKSDFNDIMHLEKRIISKHHAVLNMIGLHVGDKGIGFYETDNMGNCRFVTQKWCEMTGLTETESSDKGWTTGIHPDDRECVFDEFMRAISQGRTFSMRYRLHNIYSNKSTHVAGYGIPLYDDEVMYAYVGSIREVVPHETVQKPD